MKKTIFTIALIATTVVAMATTHTVDNNAGSAAQFTDLQTAVDAAQAGDTILVAPSPTSYGSITIKKQLVLIGSGYTSITPKIGELHFENFNASNGSSGSFLSGFEITNRVEFDPIYSNIPTDTDASLSNIILERNSIWSVRFENGGLYNYAYSNIDLHNNIFYSIIDFGSQDNVYSNINLNNNIFSGAYLDAHVSVSENNGEEYISSYQSTSGVTVSNNIFMNGSYAFNDIRGMVVENNIFYGMNIIPESDYSDLDTLSYAINLNNNITYLTAQDLTANSWFAVGTNNVDADPLFVDYPIDGAAFSIEHDYHLQAGSPGIGAGVNGEDLGIYDGMYPFPAKLNAKPKGPVVTEISPVGSPSVPAGGTIQFQFKSEIEQ